MNKKAYLQISFAWMFAIIVGAFIIFLAVFAVTKFSGIQETKQDVEAGEELGILLNPLETSFEQGSTTTLSTPSESRIFLGCEEEGDFGKQEIKVNQKFKNQWSDTDIDITFQNKYLFADRFVEGRNFYVFSKPFSFPFQVATLSYITSSENKFCFIDAPRETNEQIENLNQANLFTENCPEERTEICFDDICEISVDLNKKSVTKKGKVFYFEGDALMFAAIFSNSDLYECQLSRLMNRTKILSDVYIEKSSQTAGDCTLFSYEQLNALKSEASIFQDSDGLWKIAQIAEDLESRAHASYCRLW
ncbi:hypothetical protein HOD29_03600 [archaeon]|jgi:hypothetical protein|nr:hypothetical protein [archaeon]